METSQTLATESFSYSWLINIKPAFDSLDKPLGASLNSSEETTSKEMDYKMMKLKKSLEEAQNFNFDIPTSQSAVALVHADELFADGLIRPLYVDPSKIKAFNALDSNPSIPVSSLSSRTVFPAVRIHRHFLRKWRKSSKRVLQKYFGFLRPLCRKVGGSRRITRVDDCDRRVWDVKSWSNSPQSSPRQSTAYCTGDWCDIESSIHEAVLHCKRSIEK